MSLRHVSKPAPLHGHSTLMTQHRPQHRSEPASDMYQQPLGHLSGPINEGRQPLQDATLYRRGLPSRANHPHDVTNKSSFTPDGISGRADMYRQQNATAESQHAQYDSQQRDDWKQDDSHSYSRRESSQHGGGCRKPSRGCSPSPESVLRSSSLRSLPVLNNSFIVPAQAAKPRKVDRVTRHRCEHTHPLPLGLSALHITYPTHVPTGQSRDKSPNEGVGLPHESQRDSNVNCLLGGLTAACTMYMDTCTYIL